MAGIRARCERRRRDRRAIIENGWLRAVLEHQINLQIYESQQLAGKMTNFSRTLLALESELALPRATIKATTTCLEAI